jgi:antitoxin HicB
MALILLVQLYQNWYSLRDRRHVKRLPAAFFQLSSGWEPIRGFHQEDPKDTPSRSGASVKAQEGHRMKKKGRIGSSFDDFLKKEGLYEDVTARAIKRVIARQLDALMQDQGLSKSSLAKRMKTSRAQLDRLLDPDNESVTLGTLTRAAQAVGRHLRMELV